MHAYITNMSTKGTAANFAIILTFFMWSVLVTAATRIALDAAGDPLSPIYTPLMITPAVISSLTPPVLARVMNITPTVAATPKDVPMA